MKNCTLVILLVLSIGCRTPVNTTQPYPRHGTADDVRYHNIIKDRSLARQVDVVAVSRVITPDGLLKVQVQLVNRTRRERAIEYRFEWTDGNGIVVNTPASLWVIKHLKGGDQEAVSAVAPHAGVKDFVFKMNRK